MKKYFLFIFISMFIDLGCKAQNYFNSQLQGIIWEESNYKTPGIIQQIKFTGSEFFVIEYYSRFNRTVTKSYQYYLAGSPSNSFDSNKVGTSIKGQYIIVYVPERDKTFSFKIVNLTSNTLEYSTYSDEVYAYRKK